MPMDKPRLWSRNSKRLSAGMSLSVALPSSNGLSKETNNITLLLEEDDDDDDDESRMGDDDVRK
jgi:hypothetical protein